MKRGRGAVAILILARALLHLNGWIHCNQQDGTKE